jgi:hypothetical protein
VRVLGEEPGLGLPNQHTKACPRFQTMHCWCPPATGPGQPHEKGCYQYMNYNMSYTPDLISKCSLSHGSPHFEKPKGEIDYFLQAQLQAQAYNHALLWLNQASVYPIASACPPGLPVPLGPVNYYCNCAKESQSGVHEDSCPVTAGQQAAQAKDLAQQACNCAASSGVIGHAAYCPLASWQNVPAHEWPIELDKKYVDLSEPG